MKAITEKVLREYIEQIGEGSVVYAASLVNLLEEIDMLTVSKLRPMADAPKTGKDILFVMHGSKEMYVGFYNEYKWHIPGAEMFLEDDAIVGWIPMPIYKPEKE